MLGYEVGEWHVRQTNLVEYMYAVAAASDRVTISEYARSYENRKLLSLIITSPENHAKLDDIKETHRQLSNPSASAGLDLSSMPVVVQMSYSVHGNEPSGSNASLAVVYRLATDCGEEMDQILSNAVILVDPSINPMDLTALLIGQTFIKVPKYWFLTHSPESLMRCGQAEKEQTTIGLT